MLQQPADGGAERDGNAPATVSPTSLNFGDVAVNETSAIKKVTLKNNESGSLAISEIMAGTPYAVDPSTTCTSSLAAGASCIIGVTLTPTALGAQPAGTLTINDNASNSPQMVALSGTGVLPATVSPTSLNFGDVAVNETSAIKKVTLKNNESGSIAISEIMAGTPYAVDPSTTCTSSLAAGASCIIGVTLTPTALGAQPAGTLTINDNASNSPQMVALSGTGVLPATVSPTSLNFGDVAVNETSAIKKVTLKNNESGSIAISEIMAGTPYAVDPSTTCTSSLAAGASCIIGVTLTPTATGMQSGTLTISTSAPNSPNTVALTGTGK